MRLYQWCGPYLGEGQPDLRDQQLAVEIWVVPRRPLCGHNCKEQTEVPVWGFQAIMGNKESQHWQVTFVWYLYVICMVYSTIYLVYTWYFLLLSKTYLFGAIELLSCNPTLCACTSYFNCFHVNVPNLKIVNNGIYLVYIMHIRSTY